MSSVSVADNTAPSLHGSDPVRPRPEHVGVFHYLPGASTMMWSDAMYAIHGYERGDIVPTLATGFAHLEPAARIRAQALWAELLTSDSPVAWYYSLTTAQGRRRHVLAVAERSKGEADSEEVRGFLVDITTSVRDASHRDANLAVARSAETRASIEQAKGILMATQGIGADAAYTYLSQYSQDTNRKVSLLAQDLVNLYAAPADLLALARAICSHSSGTAAL